MTPPTTGTMKIERGGGRLHFSSQLYLTLCPSCSVSCRISQCLSLSLLSRLRPEPWPPLFITPQPFAAPLSFGWLSHCPSASTPILLQLRLVPRPPPLVDPLLVTAFGVVCRRSRCPIRPNMSPSPERKAPKHCHFWCHHGARLLPAPGLLCCCCR